MEHVAYGIQQQGKMGDYLHWIGSASAGVEFQWRYQLSAHQEAGYLQTHQTIAKMLSDWQDHTTAPMESGSKEDSRSTFGRQTHLVDQGGRSFPFQRLRSHSP